MRASGSGKSAPFVGGLLVGLAGAGVAFAAIEAGRRRRARPAPGEGGRTVVIDGARDADPIALSVQPGTEANSPGPAARLESESVDVRPETQRW